MAAITWTNVVQDLPAPELAAFATSYPEAVTAILATVHEVLSAAALGGENSQRLRRARELLAAHMATVTPGGSVAVGPIIAETEGRVSRTYAQIFASGDFGTSSYGQEFMRLVRTSPGARLPRAY